MKALLSLLLLVFFLFSITDGQTVSVKITKGESKALSLIANLPEVVNATNYVKKASKGKRRLRVVLNSDPTKDEPYYYVTVVEWNGIVDHIHFNFYVDPKMFAIKYSDVMDEGKLKPEKQCRKKLIGAYPK
ncbi:MAG: hypothetical protein ACHQHN_18330 [Sphingobacteriales bacterium]